LIGSEAEVGVETAAAGDGAAQAANKTAQISRLSSLKRLDLVEKGMHYILIYDIISHIIQAIPLEKQGWFPFFITRRVGRGRLCHK
jgi:hypothetical protein